MNRFLDDDDVVKPYYISKLVKISQYTGAQALSTFLDEFKGRMNPLHHKLLPDRRIYGFTGQDLSLGVLRNSFGSGNIFITRRAFDKVGGFSGYGAGVGAEDWEFWLRLALNHIPHQVVPDPMIFTRSDTDVATSMVSGYRTRALRVSM